MENKNRPGWVEDLVVCDIMRTLFDLRSERKESARLDNRDRRHCLIVIHNDSQRRFALFTINVAMVMVDATSVLSLLNSHCGCGLAGFCGFKHFKVQVIILCVQGLPAVSLLLLNQ